MTAPNGADTELLCTTKTNKMKTTSKFLLFISTTIIISCGEVKQNATETKLETTAIVSVNNNGVFINHKSYGEGDFTLLFVHGWCINQTY